MCRHVSIWRVDLENSTKMPNRILNFIDGNNKSNKYFFDLHIRIDFGRIGHSSQLDICTQTSDNTLSTEIEWNLDNGHVQSKENIINSLREQPSIVNIFCFFLLFIRHSTACNTRTRFLCAFSPDSNYYLFLHFLCGKWNVTRVLCGVCVCLLRGQNNVCELHKITHMVAIQWLTSGAMGTH